MSLLLLFTPSYFDNLHDYAPRIIDRYKKKYRREKVINPPEENEEATKERPSNTKRATGTELKDAEERAKYISFLKEEIRGINQRLKLAAEMRGVLEETRFRQRIKRLESARAALDAQFYEALQKQFEDDFLTLLFLSID